MKFLFLPFSIAGGLLAGLLSQKVFELIWGRIDEEEAPHPKHREIDLRKLAIALLIEGALFRLVKGFFDHGARQGFAKATGSWPGEEAPDRA